jgi:hypothetical protein
LNSLKEHFDVVLWIVGGLGTFAAFMILLFFKYLIGELKKIDGNQTKLSEFIGAISKELTDKITNVDLRVDDLDKKVAVIQTKQDIYHQEGELH